MIKNDEIYLKNLTLQTTPKLVQGEVVTSGDESFYKISNYDEIPPFFMNIVSDSDLWMFISSNGGLTAGRRNPDNALFPYYTDDRIHDSHDISGSKTIILVIKSEKTYLWEPFSSRYERIYRTERNIYKNIVGNQVIFEEVNLDLNLSFHYMWISCDQIGLVKKSLVKNNDQSPVRINILDGIQNILPSGVDRGFQLEFSTLVDGYKRNELLNTSELALYTLSSIPTDKAEPSESLKATTVWSTGLSNVKIILSSTQIDLFRQGFPIVEETDVKGKRGAYFLQSEIDLESLETQEWYIVADLNKDQADVASLSRMLTSKKNLVEFIENEIDVSTENLKKSIAMADGSQLTLDSLNVFRHCSNTLFNIMRGGIIRRNYRIEKNDFRSFIKTANKKIAEKYNAFLDELPALITHQDLLNSDFPPDPDFERLCYEYLPLTFSRRHGDPSRPWNQFSIDIKDEHGNDKLNYQGNWRDIFQNWEALALSFPEYIESMITRFVNASTADGYNPYRLTRDGFDWEVPAPSEAYANIGYWGDHQIIYLLKLLELSTKYHPEKLLSLLSKDIFVYANIPYEIKSYQDILRDPHVTIDFNVELNAEIHEATTKIGSDGSYIRDRNGQIYHVNLAEKLLVPLLVKLSNFIPEAGIWMNTQRPEWNDANNALVGYGASMVTVYYLRRYLVFCINLFNELSAAHIDISTEVIELLDRIYKALTDFKHLLDDVMSDVDRRKILDHLAQAGNDHRMNLYEHGFNESRQQLSISTMISFFKLALKYIDHSIKANKRDDDLYHAYNLIKVDEQNKISIRHLYEMLEGQVAVLSSGYLPNEDVIMLLNSLRKSSLYREDQSSYLLYPNRELPRFCEKNNIPESVLEQSKFLKLSIADKEKSIVNKDMNGDVHFNSNFRNARVLKHALEEMKNRSPELDDHEIKTILGIYETVFDHQSFTGRSGTFYKYEGLGSIYWHMVSKLLLAVQESYYRAIDSQANASVLDKLKSYYYDIQKGIGTHKNPEQYGAFPTDAYSHTPANSGAQQPGMTGQVKEDILSRFAELGVQIHDGKIHFNADLLDTTEFLNKSYVFNYYDLKGMKQSMILNPGMLAFTICQVPVIYIKAGNKSIVITRSDGSEQEIKGHSIDKSLSQSIFRRDESILKIQVLMDI